MPLTTRCRRCGRLFPVYAQQLKERRGKVACPQCGGRFDAVSALIDEPMPGDPEDQLRGTPRRRRPGPSAPPTVLALPEPRRRGVVAALLWTSGILLLAGTLAAQALWWERDLWLGDPRVRAPLDRACAALGCQLPLPRLPGTMEILAPSLGLHPDDPNALRLVLTLVNRAQVAQRLPLLQLELYDTAGELTAARRFSPAGYLPAAEPGEGLPPGGATTLTLELVMPPEAPAGFRIRLL